MSGTRSPYRQIDSLAQYAVGNSLRGSILVSHSSGFLAHVIHATGHDPSVPFRFTSSG